MLMVTGSFAAQRARGASLSRLLDVEACSRASLGMRRSRLGPRGLCWEWLEGSVLELDDVV